MVYTPYSNHACFWQFCGHMQYLIKVSAQLFKWQFALMSFDALQAKCTLTLGNKPTRMKLSIPFHKPY